MVDVTPTEVVRPDARVLREMFAGAYGPGRIPVLQQAYRIRADDSDEAVLVPYGRAYWVAARLGDRTVVWACSDLESAEEKLESIAATADGWIWARAS